MIILFSLIDFAFSDILRIVFTKILINFLDSLLQIKIDLSSYSGTLENIETLTGTCSDTICNFFSLSLDNEEYDKKNDEIDLIEKHFNVNINVYTHDEPELLQIDRRSITRN